MVFAMVRPTRRADSANGYFRKRVPADLLAILKGRKVSVHLEAEDGPEAPAIEATAIVGHEVKFSLQTSERQLLRKRHAQALLQVDNFFSGVRAGPKDLSPKQLQALAGDARSYLLAAHDEHPPQDFELEVWAEFILDAESLLKLSEGGPIKPHTLQRAERTIVRIFDVEGFLTGKGVELSVRSRRDFLEALLDAMASVVQLLQSRAKGNFAPDKEAERYPAWTPPQPQPKPQPIDGAVTTFDDLFDRWRAGTKPAPSTVSTWQGYLRRFTGHLGHTSPHNATKADAQRWKDALIAEGRQQISKTYLGALRALYAYSGRASEAPLSFSRYVAAILSPRSLAKASKSALARLASRPKRTQPTRDAHPLSAPFRPLRHSRVAPKRRHPLEWYQRSIQSGSRTVRDRRRRDESCHRKRPSRSPGAART